MGGSRLIPKNPDDEIKEEFSNSYIEIHTENDEVSSQKTFAKGEQEL
jgi:hypothetical protein